jgi:predicted lipoprotein with Yx(FWY)xxD motif
MNIAQTLLAAALAASLSGCGSDGDTAGSDTGPLARDEIDGVGTVYVDSGGRAVYVTDAEKSGEVRCVDECVDFWQPVPADGSDSEDGRFGSLARPDTGAARSPSTGRRSTPSPRRMPARSPVTTSPTSSAAPASPGTSCGWTGAHRRSPRPAPRSPARTPATEGALTAVVQRALRRRGLAQIRGGVAALDACPLIPGRRGCPGGVAGGQSVTTAP